MKLTKTFLAIGIAIIFAFFVSYGVYVFYEGPESCYEKFSGQEDYYSTPEYGQCQEDYQDAKERFTLINFIIFAVVGFLAIILGFLLFSVGSIGPGILGGGILLVLFDITRYWGSINKYLRFIMLGVILALLIFLGYKAFKKETVVSTV